MLQKKEEADDSGEEVDIEDALKKEVNALQAETSGDRERRFQVVDSGAKNCVFIKTTVDNPCELVHAIFSDIAETGKQKSRFILKFIPISATCKATEEALTKIADPFLETHFGYSDKGRTFGILFKSRNNNQIGRNMVFNVFGKIVSDMHPGNKVNLNDSEETIIVDVLRKVCCLSVLKDFFKFKKYNLFEVAKNHVTTSQSDIKSDSGSANGKAASNSEQVEKDETELDKPEGQSVTTEGTASSKKADDGAADTTNKETSQEDQHVET